MKISGDSKDAMETGQWLEEWQQADGDVKLQGSYSRHWAKLGNLWTNHAEIEVPLTCTGTSSYCAANWEAISGEAGIGVMFDVRKRLLAADR